MKLMGHAKVNENETRKIFDFAEPTVVKVENVGHRDVIVKANNKDFNLNQGASISISAGSAHLECVGEGVVAWVVVAS